MYTLDNADSYSFGRHRYKYVLGTVDKLVTLLVPKKNCHTCSTIHRSWCMGDTGRGAWETTLNVF